MRLDDMPAKAGAGSKSSLLRAVGRLASLRGARSPAERHTSPLHRSPSPVMASALTAFASSPALAAPGAEWDGLLDDSDDDSDAGSGSGGEGAGGDKGDRDGDGSRTARAGAATDGHGAHGSIDDNIAALLRRRVAGKLAPVWRHRADCTHCGGAPLPSELLQPLCAFRAIVWTVIGCWRLQQLGLRSIRREAQGVAERVEIVLQLSFDPLRSWMARLVSQAMRSILRRPERNMDVDDSSGSLLQRMLRSSNKKRLAARMKALRVHVRGVITGMLAAVEDDRLPTQVLKPLTLLLRGGAVFPRGFLWRTELHVLKLSALRRTESMLPHAVASLSDLGGDRQVRCSVLLANFLLVRLLINRVLLDPVGCNMLPHKPGAIVAGNLKAVASVLYICLRRMVPGLPSGEEAKKAAAAADDAAAKKAGKAVGKDAAKKMSKRSKKEAKRKAKKDKQRAAKKAKKSVKTEKKPDKKVSKKRKVKKLVKRTKDNGEEEEVEVEVEEEAESDVEDRASGGDGEEEKGAVSKDDGDGDDKSDGDGDASAASDDDAGDDSDGDDDDGDDDEDDPSDDDYDYGYDSDEDKEGRRRRRRERSERRKELREAYSEEEAIASKLFGADHFRGAGLQEEWLDGTAALLTDWVDGMLQRVASYA
eukprot:PLAT4375.1.p1 GENE.PLAT4375.1~~PLAT4375.1.p1  ORF type:complete len:762 (+),score=278.14 PLAT4375.1:344-2287(+)